MAIFLKLNNDASWHGIYMAAIHTYLDVFNDLQITNIMHIGISKLHQDGYSTPE